ncbi:MAG: Ig-like domain-containing protein [Gemmatimonadales bacterium]
MRIPSPVARTAVMLLLLAACGGSDSAGPPPTRVIAVSTGDGVIAAVRTAVELTARVTDPAGNPESGVSVRWSVVSGGGSIPSASTSDADGFARATFTLGQTAGPQRARANVDGVGSATADFTVTAVAGPATQLKKSAGDGQTGWSGVALPIAYAVTVQDAFNNPVLGATVDWVITSGGGSLSATSVATGAGGIATVVHTLGTAAAKQTVVASTPAVAGVSVSFTSTALAGIKLVSTVAVPANYGLHDTFVRDGLAFLCVWDEGVYIYDVGNGIKGGTIASPQLVGSVKTAGGNVHNAWWYHSPSGAKQYLFVGEEGPGSVGSASSGSIHVVDVSNLAAPVEVGSYTLAGAGTHNFWVDENAEILYAAYYNGGVVALDVSGSLPSDMRSRELARIQPGGPGNTYVWGVMQYQDGDIYASDMLSGFWRLRYNGGSFSVVGGGNNVPERFTSDLWVQNGYGYTGGWGNRGIQPGNAVKIWQVAGAAPVLVDSVITSGITTVSDVQVSADGKLLVFSAENGPNAGLHVYSLAASPSQPVFLASYLVSQGLHTATVATIAGQTYVFAARNPASPALLIFDITSLAP